MSLSVLHPNHDALVKEEEYDDYEYNQEPLTDSGLTTSGMTGLRALFDPVDGVKREVEEEQEQSITPGILVSGISTLAQHVPLFDPSKGVKEEAEEPAIKDEPLDLEDSQIGADELANHPDYGIAALLSLATGQYAQGMKQSASALFNHLPKMEDEDVKNVPRPQQASSSRRKAQRPRSSSTNDEDDDEKIYISHEDVLLPRAAPKRGRPMGSRHSAEEVATDPKKRRQAHNRDAALRYREKKKMETWELKYEEKQREDKNVLMMEKMEDMSREVLKWKERCLKAFNFLPNLDFEDHSPLSIPSSRRSVSATPSSDSACSLPSSLPEKVLSLFTPQPQTAAAKSRAKRKQGFELLKEEEADLSARNDSLRAEALQLYIEIVGLRKKMGFAAARTSADTDLPALLRSSEYSSIQISDFLTASSQS